MIMISTGKLGICISEPICLYDVLVAVRVLWKLGYLEYVVHVCMVQRCGPLIPKHLCESLDIVIINE